MQRHVYLTGYRGSGKTSVGRRLAKKLGCAVIDLDDKVEEIAGMSIREIFEREGEPKFRDRETAALKLVSKMPPCVISLGGGAILREQNRKVIKATGYCIWLKVDAPTVAKRLRRDAMTAARRPSLTSLPPREEIESLLATREPMYAAAADATIDAVGKGVLAVTGEAMALAQAVLLKPKRT